MDRIAMLREFAAKAPEDPFPRYGLAMELVNRGQLDEACEVFQELVERMPEYVATYLMYGKALRTRGMTDDAARVLRLGAARSAERGDAHARSEILAELEELGASE
jgi:predicted Zn-dependent protease